MMLFLSYSCFAQEEITGQENAVQQNVEEQNVIQEDRRNHIFSFDFEYLMLGLTNNGWGLGIQYEQYFGWHLAGKVKFAHTVIKVDDKFCPTVNFGCFGTVYPFNEDLNGPYISFGGYFDFFGIDNEEEDKEKNVYLSIFPVAGWKLKICRFLSSDIYCGYKYIFNSQDVGLDKKFEALTKKGIKFGASLKIHFSQI